MREDKACMVNLADDPEHSDLRVRLRKSLEQALKEQGDPRMLGSGEIFDRYEYVGNATHSWKRYEEGVWKRQGY